MNNFEGTIELEYEKPQRGASVRKQVCTAGLSLEGEKPLKYEEIMIKKKNTLASHSWCELYLFTYLFYISL